MNRLVLVLIMAVAAGGIIKPSAAQTSPATDPAGKIAPIPVILDTDTGNDVDDTWALALLLKNPHFDIKLITTTDGKRDYRARLIARMLTIAKRTDIPIGLGAGTRSGGGKLSEWVKDFPLSKFTGRVEKDGVQALIEAVNESKQRMTIIAIGPLQTLAAALERDPALAEKVDLVGMQGSVFRGYGGSPSAQPEFNIKRAIPAAQKVFAAPWHSAIITPLDTCGLPEITLTGKRLDLLRSSDDKIVQGILQCARLYAGKPDDQPLKSTSVLYDTVAIYLAEPGDHPLLKMQKLNLAVTDKGMTIVSPTGAPMSVATSWKDVEGYREHLLYALVLKPPSSTP
jgi:inosine-uridine nucleoside N-ribohydrolase